ncbi:uncharacterized protein LOC116159219 isoform X2 [Photinus pyralis]|uniref:uncharacterized protein LOC116159219 isoform X2 n=1 Tax=Photinus pyralis TaxID=7054 RepID=UPI001267150A|nr:uncharacterized protein LOC116159219 isoform X2 [Photinus pyralis]
MTNDQMWSVIKFPKENKVAVVPSTWLCGNICYWPPFNRKRVEEAIEKGETPNTTTWQQFQYSPLRNNTFEAERKSRKATITSDLDTQTEEEDEDCKGKRKRRTPKPLYSSGCSSASEEEEEIITLPKPPNPSSSKPQQLQDITNKHNMKMSHQKKKCGAIMSSVPDVDSANVPGSSYLSSHLHEDGIIRYSPSSRGGTPTSTLRAADHADGRSNDEYLRHILRKQNILQAMLSDLSAKVADIENMLKDNAHRAENATPTDSIFVKLPHLPVNCDNDLQELENHLSDQNEFALAVKEISQLGGNKTYEFIFRAAKQLITDRFAGAEFSFLGRKQKKKFADLKLALLLKQAAVRLFQKTEKEVENDISKWLRKCTDRSKKQELRN